MLKKILTKTKTKSPNTAIFFSNIITQKDRKNLENFHADTNLRLKNYCKIKNIGLIDNENLKKNHFGIKKLHLNRKGNALLANNLLNFVEGN